ncbi:hypothetical protein N1027_13155 [Herbiconiux sp. CPCC 205763]|uniref:Uncharacterized protein n=1 Tax=Herbiconiux aconitum TaxID=2970913 RepID=A0ABT2GS79_9MICO|nr:hypothetical protein [Herbiconiux aconitum]MCS5719082.1 hypothetical protein [Herbiconiux aconitum]
MTAPRAARPFTRTRRAGSGVLAGILLAASSAVSGCAGSGGPTASPQPTRTTSASTGASTPAPPTVVDGVGLAILQNRPDYAKRVMQLSVTNEGAGPLAVLGARFESPQFAEPVAWSKAASTEVPAGLTRYLPVQLPAAVCPTPDATEPTLTLTIADASGTTRVVTGQPSDPFGVLPRIAGEDCLDEAVAGVAALTLDDTLEVTGAGDASVAHLRLQVDPADGKGELHLDEARFTILLAPAEGTTWPLDATVTGGDAPREFTLDAVPARCDPHAIAEDKRGTFLPVVLDVAGGPSGTVSVPSSDALRLALYDFIAAHCGFAPAPAG